MKFCIIYRCAIPALKILRRFCLMLDPFTSCLLVTINKNRFKRWCSWRIKGNTEGVMYYTQTRTIQYFIRWYYLGSKFIIIVMVIMIMLVVVVVGEGA